MPAGHHSTRASTRRSRRRRPGVGSWRRVTCALLAALALSGCASSERPDGEDDSARDRPTVFAASSLAEVMRGLEPDADYQFAASDTLALQLREGARADLFVAANTTLPDRLHEEGLLQEPIAFASNRIVLAVPARSRIGSLDQLARDRDARIVLAADGVPLGDYTVRVLDDLGASRLVDRASSRERDARAVITKVSLGEADAGFVYRTDALAAGDAVELVELPHSDANRATYAVALTSRPEHPRAATKLLARITSQAGRAELARKGFGPP